MLNEWTVLSFLIYSTLIVTGWVYFLMHLSYGFVLIRRLPKGAIEHRMFSNYITREATGIVFASAAWLVWYLLISPNLEMSMMDSIIAMFIIFILLMVVGLIGYGTVIAILWLILRMEWVREMLGEDSAFEVFWNLPKLFSFILSIVVGFIHCLALSKLIFGG